MDNLSVIGGYTMTTKFGKNETYLLHFHHYHY